MSALRDVCIAGLVAVSFLATGSCTPPGVADIVAGAPFDLDISLRALAQGWFKTDRTIPVTIVDIDEGTHAAWGRPALTPRAELARLIEIVAEARPRAVVVDIDLSWGTGAAPDSGQRALRRVLDEYRGPARLVFPKRLVPDSMQRLTPAASDLDDLIGTRPNLAWANAVFATSSGGAVRDWEEWVEGCVNGIARRFPAVATVMAGRADSLAGTTSGTTPAECDAGAELPRRHRLLLGPPMTGPTRVPTPHVQSVRAGVLLDPAVRIDPGIFTDRVVLIGSTHADAGDLWLTPRGIVPGVELLASTVHYWPLSMDDVFTDTFRFRLVVVLVFLGLAFVTWWLAGIVTAFVVIAGMLLVTSVAVGALDWFWFFDAAAAAIVLVVAYETLRAVADFVQRVGEEYRRVPARGGQGATLRRATIAIGRACLREQEPSEGRA